MDRQDFNALLAEILHESKRYVDCRSRGLLNLRQIGQGGDITLEDGILTLVICVLELQVGHGGTAEAIQVLEELTSEGRTLMDALNRALHSPDPQDWEQTKLILDLNLRFADLFLCEEGCPPRRYHFGEGVPEKSRRAHLAGSIFRKLRRAFS